MAQTSAEISQAVSLAFAEEVARLRDSGVLGGSGRLLELFDFLAGRGADAKPASQSEIAQMVFGESGPDSDDATVRVYVHRLRKRLVDFYASEEGQRGAGQLSIPAGLYALRLKLGKGAASSTSRFLHGNFRVLAFLIPLVILAAFASGWFFHNRSAQTPVNAIWQPFLESDRPIIVAMGDYYIFGEIDRVRPEEGRLIRDFRINSETDLARLQESMPDRYGSTEDVGLNYLPFSSAYGLQSLMPVLAQHKRPIGVIPASEVTSDTFLYFNIIYVGLFSGMGLLEDVNFMGSNYTLGESYDELIDMAANKSYISGEAQTLASRGYYKDFGYFSMFREPGGALVAVVAGERDTGLRGIAPILTGANLPDQLSKLAEQGEAQPYEALFEITGQQGADLGEKLIEARFRP